MQCKNTGARQLHCKYLLRYHSLWLEIKKVRWELGEFEELEYNQYSIFNSIYCAFLAEIKIIQNMSFLHLEVSVESILGEVPLRSSQPVAPESVWSSHFSEELLCQCLLCHKEPACRFQSPLLGAFCLLLAGSLWHKGPLKGPFRAWKPTILMPSRTSEE